MPSHRSSRSRSSERRDEDNWYLEKERYEEWLVYQQEEEEREAQEVRALYDLCFSQSFKQILALSLKSRKVCNELQSKQEALTLEILEVGQSSTQSEYTRYPSRYFECCNELNRVNEEYYKEDMKRCTIAIFLLCKWFKQIHQKKIERMPLPSSTLPWIV